MGNCIKIDNKLSSIKAKMRCGVILMNGKLIVDADNAKQFIEVAFQGNNLYPSGRIQLVHTKLFSQIAHPGKIGQFGRRLEDGSLVTLDFFTNRCTTQMVMDGGTVSRHIQRYDLIISSKETDELLKDESGNYDVCSDVWGDPLMKKGKLWSSPGKESDKGNIFDTKNKRFMVTLPVGVCKVAISSMNGGDKLNLLTSGIVDYMLMNGDRSSEVYIFEYYMGNGRYANGLFIEYDGFLYHMDFNEGEMHFLYKSRDVDSSVGAIYYGSSYMNILKKALISVTRKIRGR